MTKSQFGMIGLGVMGRNFLLNVAEKGFSGVGYDLDAEKRRLLLEDGKDFSLQTAENLTEFLEKLESPRKIMILVPANVVDIVINDLIGHLDKGDLVIDGGNSHFPDTERREKLLNDNGFEFLGVGVSGGEEGARHGCAIMIGGKPENYELVRPIFEAASAKVNGEPCAAHVGNGSAGHFVKMVHNGIEYGLMQLIAETYDIFKRCFEFEDSEISDIFADWNEGELNSFLVEITATVLHKKDAETGNNLVEMILDTAGQKGTGKWTSEVAMDMGVPIPTIDSAVTMRQISAMKKERTAANGILGTNAIKAKDFRKLVKVNDLKGGLLASFIITYAQGLALLKVASAEKNYEIDLTEVAKIWRGGCIIRAALLEDIRAAFAKNKDLSNLLLDEKFADQMKEIWTDLLTVCVTAPTVAMPTMCLSASLNYFNAYRTERLPANLIQAQRDFFGAHTYQRIDKEGIFHTPDWDE
ncbi:MAG: NADP-dependent phosphogluconate dehydrogenase [Pyrinomonadaceae bacterium]|nr:NADP-dependent phosphogluconate dehydrogenase [Pyrinomonadaceae bacterium]